MPGESTTASKDWERPWPSIHELRGRIIPVLSGHANSRLAYLRDKGSDPAVAINDSGLVIEVHKSESTDTLWYWTGQLQSDGSITWARHGQYDDGKSPSVAMDNDGWIVEVHKSQIRDTLFYRVGHMDSDLEVTWGDSHEYDDGIEPTIRFDDLDQLELYEIHTSQTDWSQNWYWDATLDRVNWELNFGDHDQTSEALWEREAATSDAGSLQVRAGDDGTGGTDTLQYTTDSGTDERICYPQEAFMEFQQDNDSQLLQWSTRFYAVSSGNAEDASSWAEDGWVTRIWSYAQSDSDEILPSFPSTDTPFESWYLTLLSEADAVE
jgi:hypothetical protein